MKAFKEYWTRAFDFKGRTSRRDYWTAIGFLILVSFVIGFVLGLAGLTPSITVDSANNIKFNGGAGVFIYGAWYFINIIPGISVEVRRLHDINKSGWFMLLGFIPIVNAIGSLVLFIFTLLPSVNEGNKYNN